MLLIVCVVLYSLYNILCFPFSTFSGNKSEQEGTDNKINIFSLASGHLYERLLRYVLKKLILIYFNLNLLFFKFI